MIPAITIFIAVLIALFVYRRSVARKKYQDAVYLRNCERIAQCLAAIDALDDYVTWVHRDHIKTEYCELIDYFRNKTDYYKHEPLVKSFNIIFEDFDRYISDYNANYVQTQKEILREYFDHIEGKKLDDQQREAVLTDEYSNLIIAGAGSGKTLTILGKIKYLIEQKSIKPENILPLSFTKKTVDELNERLHAIGIGTKATTFHKLGYDTIKDYCSDKPPTISNDNTLGRVVQQYLQNDIFENAEAIESYIQYVACYMNVPQDMEQYQSLGEKIDTEKGIDFQTLKSKCEPLNKIAKAKLDTLQGEKVKSVEELTIANFLYLNGIAYEYEKSYPHGTVVYRPDFYLIDYDIWLEHFGVDENNKNKLLTPQNEQKYVEEMDIKRRAHEENGTKLLETYSYFNKDKVLLVRLEKMLKEEQVAFRPRDARDIYQKMADNDQRFGSEIIKLIESFINLSKSRRMDAAALTQLYIRNSMGVNDFMLERQQLFLRFVLPILAKYDNVLSDNNEIDFNDMINRATDIIRENKPNHSFQYIIVDEYQDISVSRFNLIKEIRDLTGARLICVGDDWQSIYRFAGSDISLFRNFDKYVGKNEKLLIENTYRNSQSLIDISAKFIQKNKSQIVKNPKSKKQSLPSPVKFVHYDHDSIEEVFVGEIQRLAETYGDKPILVLGRHSFDIDDLIKWSPSNRIKYIERYNKLEVKGFDHIDIKFLTVHKSKGLEADNVIVIKLKNDLLGFPNKMTDDPILSLLLNDDEAFRFAEERRLFYVALTRTKNECVLLVPSETSVFADELMADHNYLLTTDGGALKTTHCPYCQTGKLIIRRAAANATPFLGCSHYPNCDQTFNNVAILEDSILCPNCQSGFMVKRTGKFGDFLGCTSYPKCNQTIRL